MTEISSAVDRAFKRCSLLAAIVNKEYERALSNPTDQRYVDLGVIDAGGKESKRKTKSKANIEESFKELLALVDHIIILDMAATFEGVFKERLATAIGEARKAVREKSSFPVMRDAREALIRDSNSVQGFAAAIELIQNCLPKDLQETLKRIRKSRNDFAHGEAQKSLTSFPAMGAAEARDALQEVVRLL